MFRVLKHYAKCNNQKKKKIGHGYTFYYCNDEDDKDVMIMLMIMTKLLLSPQLGNNKKVFLTQKEI